jgi:cell shape-determining protein MreC
MNFGSNQNNQNRNQNSQKEQNDETLQSYGEQETEITDTINITVPRYV